MRPYANLEGLRVKCYTAWLLKARGLVDLGLMGWIWPSEVFCLSTHALALLNSWQTFKNWEILIKIWFPALESSSSWQSWAYILTWQQHLEGSMPVWATVTSTPYYIWGGQWPFTAAAVHPFLSFFFLATPGSICFPGGSNGKESACNADTRVQSQGLEDPLEKELATHSSILDWRIPWTEKPGRLQSMGYQRVGHNWATNFDSHFFHAAYRILVPLPGIKPLPL